MPHVSVHRNQVLLLAQCEKNFVPWKGQKRCHEAIEKGKSLSKEAFLKKNYLRNISNHINKQTNKQTNHDNWVEFKSVPLPYSFILVLLPFWITSLGYLFPSPFCCNTENSQRGDYRSLSAAGSILAGKLFYKRKKKEFSFPVAQYFLPLHVG